MSVILIKFIMERKKIIEQLLKDGASIIKNAKVLNVTVTPDNESYRVALTLDREVPGYRQDENGEYVEGMTKVIFTRLFSVNAVLREDANASFAVNHIASHPEALVVLLNNAKIDVIQERVKAGSEYHNAFSSDATKTTTVLHDSIYNSVVDIQLSERSIAKLDKLSNALMGF